MVTPRPWCAPTPPLVPPFVLCYGRLCVSGTDKPLCFYMLHVFCDTCGFLGLGGGIRDRCLVRQLVRVDDEEAYLCSVEAPVSILHWYAADDTLPMPASRRLLAGASRFFEQQR